MALKVKSFFGDMSMHRFVPKFSQRVCNRLETHLHVLARLNQLPHQTLQLIVPLDQIAEVRLQCLLKI